MDLNFTSAEITVLNFALNEYLAACKKRLEIIAELPDEDPEKQEYFLNLAYERINEANALMMKINNLKG